MNLSDIQLRDPFVLKYDDLYYLYGSTDKNIWFGDGIGFDTYSSSDLIHWDGPFQAFRPPAGYWGTSNFWAPEVYEYNGAFYMLASFIGDGCMRGTAVLKASCPKGPFLPWSNGAVTPKDWMCLDGTLYIDADGSPWMVFCHEWVQIGDGTVCAVRLDNDLSRAVSEPVVLFKSSDAAYSRQAYSPTNDVRGYVTDGCFLHRLSNGKLIMLWSCVGENGYCLGYALSETGCLSGQWTQTETPLFADDGGHGMVFRACDGRLLLALHRPNKTPNERAVFIELEEAENGLRVL